MSLTARDIAEITRLLEDSSFDELELEIDGLKVHLKRGGAPPARENGDSPRFLAKGDGPRESTNEAPAVRTLCTRSSPGRSARAFVRHLLSRAQAGRAAVRRGGRERGAGHHHRHHRSHETDEHGARGSRGRVREIRARDGNLVEYGEACCCSIRGRRLEHPARAHRKPRRDRGAHRAHLHALGIETVLAASEADRDSLPARLVTRTVCIGPAHPAASYLKPELLVQAALGTGCDAIHPGYGFLSERAAFARLCEQQGLTFIGPTADQLEAVGDKLAARALAADVGVPVAPGGEAPSLEAARELARRIGAPLLVKAAGGGGGRGMKLVERAEDLEAALALAAAEAGAAFGDARVYLERFVSRARHVEVQVLGDGAGNVVHLGERDCSVQRRYQKLIEETPAPALSAEFRTRLHEAALRFAARLKYRGAGTVEFLVDVARGEFFFLEMNARIQVEHPVTEVVSGIDIVAEQIAIAGGGGLRLARGESWREGCAIECRMNAEDPARDFAPSPGTVRLARWPEGEGIRVDTHIESGARVPPFYDSLLGKIIAHGRDRAQALARLRAAVAVTRIEGVATNLGLHAEVLADPEFASGGVDTDYLARLLDRRQVRAAAVHG